MLTVNVYHDGNLRGIPLASLTGELREFLARELTRGERILPAKEINVSLISSVTLAMIAPIEIEITAHQFPERVSRSDEICLRTRTFVMSKMQEVKDVWVWLVLAELGHSWEE